MHHLFIDEKDVFGTKIRVYEEEALHMAVVLRLKENEEVLASNFSGIDYLCKIESINKKEVVLEILEKLKTKSELSSEIVLFQALPKFEKMEFIIEKSVELGVKKIVPIKTERCIVKLDETKVEKKILRWQNISKTAAKQAKRNIIPKIETVMKFEEALKNLSDFDKVFIAYEENKEVKESVLLLNKIKKGEKIAIFIGPEGGFTKEEIEKAKENKLINISLGNRILRTETASLCFLSFVMLSLEGQDE